MTAAEFAAWAGGLLAVLGILGVLVKILRVAHRAANRLEHVEALAAELEHNGGGSVKDAVHRTETAVGRINDRLDAQQERLTKTEAKVEALALVASPAVVVTNDGVSAHAPEQTPR